MKKQSALTLGLAGMTLALGIHTCLHANPAPELKTDNSPLPADARPAITFAPVVKRVAPSVVNIYSDKTIRADQGMAP